MYDPVRDALLSNTIAAAVAAEEERQRVECANPMMLSEVGARVVVEGDVLVASSSGQGVQHPQQTGLVMSPGEVGEDRMEGRKGRERGEVGGTPEGSLFASQSVGFFTLCTSANG